MLSLDSINESDEKFEGDIVPTIIIMKIIIYINNRKPIPIKKIFLL